MDRLGADFFQVISCVKEKLGIEAVAIQIPLGKESSFEGVIDLIDMEELSWEGNEGETIVRRSVQPERNEAAKEWREKLIDTLSAESDELTEKYLAGEPIPAVLIRRELHRAVLERKLLPILAGASRRNMGVQPLIDAVVDYLPAPDEIPNTMGRHIKKEEDIPVPCDSSAVPLGLVFKICNDREAGSLCYVRMYSGTIKTGATLYNVGKRRRERANRILRMHSNKSEPLDGLAAGDIGVIIGMKLAQTGDTIGSEGWPVLLDTMQFPEPVISVSLEPKTISEGDKLKEILENLSREDPTFTARDNEETGQLIISGMGELHLDVLVTKILKDYGLQARVGNPQVTYRESINKTVERTERYSKIVAGKDNTATLTLKLEPQSRGSGNRYGSVLKNKEKIPGEIFDAVERGVRGALDSGILLGYPCIDVGVTLTDIEYSELSGTEFAFEACASIGFDEAAKEAEPFLLEPIMAVDLFSPKESVGDVISLITQRGGQVLSMDSKWDIDQVKAAAPMAKMFGFMTSLRSVSQGRANFSMEFSHFEKKN
jgi:elongation factor G